MDTQERDIAVAAAALNNAIHAGKLSIVVTAEGLGKTVWIHEPVKVSTAIVSAEQRAKTTVQFIPAITNGTQFNYATRGPNDTEKSNERSHTIILATVVTLVTILLLVVAAAMYYKTHQQTKRVKNTNETNTDVDTEDVVFKVESANNFNLQDYGEEPHTFSADVPIHTVNGVTLEDSSEYTNNSNMTFTATHQRKYSVDADADVCLHALHISPSCSRERHELNNVISNDSNGSIRSTSSAASALSAAASFEESSYRMSMSANSNSLRVQSVRRENPLYYLDEEPCTRSTSTKETVVQTTTSTL